MKIPSRVRVSACTMCQLDCPLCHTPRRRKHGDYIGWGYLTFNNFKKFLDRNPKIKYIDLSWEGEMFLNPELNEIIKYAYEKKVELNADIGVNLNNVSEETIKALVKYRFRRLSVSIDGASEKTYQSYRKNGKLSRVLKNILLINRYKKEYRSVFPSLHWQFVIFGHNAHEINLARQIASKLEMPFSVKLSWDASYSPVKNKKVIKHDTGLEALSREEFYRKHKCGYLSETCRQLIEEPAINYDGRLFGCCKNIQESFGNVFKDGLYKCMNSRKYKDFVQAVFNRLKVPESSPCYYCSVYSSNIKGALRILHEKK